MEASRGLARARPAPALGPPGLLGSKRLARRAAAGDERAFAAIFEQHHQELYRYCLAILRNTADAEDALQATMSKALQALPGESREIRLRPWLFRVAHNESIAILRERRPGETAPEEPEPIGGIEPDAAAEQSERLRTLVSDLKQLPDRQRSALVMRELSGLAYSEIAAALDCGEGAARQTVYEARSALQTRAEGRQMGCEEARRAISAGDRRRLRGRKLRAHLNGCEGCRDFEAAIAVRRNDLAAIAPPLPVAAAAAIFAGLAGGGGAGAAGAGVAAVGGGAGGLAGGVAGTAALKGASVAAALVIAAGAADVTGVIDVPNPFGDGGSSERGGRAASGNPAASPGRGDTSATDADAAPSAGVRSGDRGWRGGTRGSAATGTDGGARGGASGQSNAGGGRAQSDIAPGQSGSTPGQSGAAPGQTGTTPGQSGTAPGQSGTTPGQSGTAPGQSGATPGQSGGAPPPGQSGTAPGLSGSTPGQSGTVPGQSGATPGQSEEPNVPPGQAGKG